MSRAREYWSSGEGLGNITPKNLAWPEGDDFPQFLQTIFAHEPMVVEFGCGVGRLAKLFKPSQYVGLDICEPALRIARDNNPDHKFIWTGQPFEYPRGTCLFAHTVFLHIPDEELRLILKKLSSHYPKILMSEILGEDWARPEGRPPAFNREMASYIDLFRESGFEWGQTWQHDYPYYKDTVMTMLGFRRTE